VVGPYWQEHNTGRSRCRDGSRGLGPLAKGHGFIRAVIDVQMIFAFRP